MQAEQQQIQIECKWKPQTMLNSWNRIASNLQFVLSFLCVSSTYVVISFPPLPLLIAMVWPQKKKKKMGKYENGKWNRLHIGVFFDRCLRHAIGSHFGVLFSRSGLRVRWCGCYLDPKRSEGLMNVASKWSGGKLDMKVSILLHANIDVPSLAL